MTIIQSPSPNHNARPMGVGVSALVIHGTVGTDAGDLAWTRDPVSKVSYHFLVLRTGVIHQMVKDDRRAWHAGSSKWNGRNNVNDFSIGIGLSNKGPGEPFRPAQYAAAGDLVFALSREHTIDLANVVAHYHISPGRKTDPWEHFNWGAMFGRVLWNFALAVQPPAA